MNRWVVLTARLATLALLVGVLADMVQAAEVWAEQVAGAGIAGLISVPVMDLLALREKFRRGGDLRYAGLTTLLVAVLSLAAAVSVFRHL